MTLSAIEISPHFLAFSLDFSFSSPPIIVFQMSINSFLFLLCLCIIHANSIDDSSSPYLSPSIFFPNYQKMLKTFRIFVYIPSKPFSYSSPAESSFYSALLNSPFVTRNAEEAHLFFFPFPSDVSSRSLARLVRDLRIKLPYWNRTLGADHFYLSCAGISYISDRNIVELKKNSVQISCFPIVGDKFVPHKDITLPPLVKSHVLHAPPPTRNLGYVKYGWVKDSVFVEELAKDPLFLIESEPFDESANAERQAGSNFCLFEYGGGDVSGIGESLRFGCVPVIITGGPIHDLPLIDVLRWQDIILFVGTRGGVKQLKRVLDSTGMEARENMRKLGVTAAQHFVWNESPQPLDSFNTLMYQLWLRRHTIRYPQAL